MTGINPADFIRRWQGSPWRRFGTAWELTQAAPAVIEARIGELGEAFVIEDRIAVHRSAQVETGAILKPPVIIGPECFVATGAYLRGGVWLERSCIIGPACEAKTSFLFSGSKIAHLSFCGDSVIGEDANVEAGAMIANYRNEWSDKVIRIRTADGIIETGVDKFGVLCGDGARIGANAVIAPGALIPPGGIIGRGSLIDQGAQA